MTRSVLRVSTLAALVVSMWGCSPTTNGGTQTPSDKATGGSSASGPAPLDVPPGSEELDADAQAMTEDIAGQLDYYTSSVRDNCGIESRVHWASFNAADKLTGLASTVASACQGLLHAAGEYCGDPAQRDRFTARVEAIECQHVPDRGGAGIFLDGKTLLVRVVVENTGAGGDPAAYFAADRVEGLKFLEKM